MRNPETLECVDNYPLLEIVLHESKYRKSGKKDQLPFLYDNLTRKQMVFLCFYENVREKVTGFSGDLILIHHYFQSIQGVNSSSKSHLTILHDEEFLAKGTVRLSVMSGLTPDQFDKR